VKRTRACEQDQDGTSWFCAQAVSKHVWHIPLLSVQRKTNDGQRISPKYVEFYFKNKFEELVHLIGFIIRKMDLHLKHFLFPTNTDFHHIVDAKALTFKNCVSYL